MKHSILITGWCVSILGLFSPTFALADNQAVHEDSQIVQRLEIVRLGCDQGTSWPDKGACFRKGTEALLKGIDIAHLLIEGCGSNAEPAGASHCYEQGIKRAQDSRLDAITAECNSMVSWPDRKACFAAGLSQLPASKEHEHDLPADLARKVDVLHEGCSATAQAQSTAQCFDLSLTELAAHHSLEVAINAGCSGGVTWADKRSCYVAASTRGDEPGYTALKNTCGVAQLDQSAANCFYAGFSNTAVVGSLDALLRGIKMSSNRNGAAEASPASANGERSVQVANIGLSSPDEPGARAAGFAD